ncbi:MAG: hypothetical protein Q7S50_04950 [bacterium]|nr:hypothetical protein [bacterium]
MQSQNRGASGFLLSALFITTLLAVPAYAQATEWHIQDNATGGDCASIGTWDAPAKTCTLTQDLNQGIIIDNDNVTLDGSGRMVIGSGVGSDVFLFFKVKLTGIATDRFSAILLETTDYL